MLKVIAIPIRTLTGDIVGVEETLVDWVCPFCGEEIGDIEESEVKDGDEHLASKWKGNCGHIITYEDLEI